jgi:hypothetical protein
VQAGGCGPEVAGSGGLAHFRRESVEYGEEDGAEEEERERMM